MRRNRGFTLAELLIVVAVVAIVLTLAAPSFSDFILVQRLKGTSSELITDFQYARSEAVSRGRPVFVAFRLPGGGASMSCYTIYTDTHAPTWETVANGLNRCDCTRAAGARCQTSVTELRTVQILPDTSVSLAVADQRPAIAFDPVTGGIVSWVPDVSNPTLTPFTITASIGGERSISTIVQTTGRPQNCLPSGANVTGYTAC
jgi:prepilin-type N-terminal cleavage/methylation domain-containing protein